MAGALQRTCAAATLIGVSFVATHRTGMPVALAAENCAQVNDRIFGTDGKGGLSAQFRQLKARVDEDRRLGRQAALEKDSAEYHAAAARIVAGARTMRASNCKPRLTARVAAT